MRLTVGSLINNGQFDINCRFKVYSYQYGEEGELLYDSYDEGNSRLTVDDIDDCDVTYITVETETYAIIIECNYKED